MRSYIFKKSYRILREGIDFFELREEANGGTRAKRLVYVPETRKKAIFKYDNGRKFRKGEDCSEKIASELAITIGIPTAKIDLAESMTGEPGLLSYLFVDKEKGESHDDMEFFLDINKNNESEKYTILNMKNELNKLFPDVNFEDFLRIVFFDALVGERDRHIGNWGITKKNGRHSISPLYDTANCLLIHFQDISYRNKILSNKDGFENFVSKNKLAIYKDDGSGNYVPTTSAIDYLLDKYPNFTLKQIKKLKKLKDAIIYNIVNRIPNTRMDDELKMYICKFLIKQRDDIIMKGESYGK